MSCNAVPRSPGIRRQAHSARIDPTSQHGGTMRFDAVLFDNGGTLTHRTSPVAAVRALAARLGVVIGESNAAPYWRPSNERGKPLVEEKRRPNLSHPHLPAA